MKKSILQQYAKLIATVGGNVQPGQTVILRTQLDQPDFVTLLVEECYKAGARKVTVEWDHQPLTALHMQYGDEELFSRLETWEKEKLSHQVETLPVVIYLLSEDPNGLNHIDLAKYSRVMQARKKIIKPFRDQMDNKYQWCIAAVPGKDWAKLLFPGKSKRQAEDLLWDAILTASRAKEDPIAAWKAHNEPLAKRCDYLNQLHISSLHSTSSNGTDLTVGMIEDALFLGGGETSLQGIYFNPNIPSEEIFITPKRGQAEGIVYSSKPLSYNGALIDNFSLRFENGKVVEVHAEQNEDLLKDLVAMDEGSAYLGECALIPYDSPIQNTGILFYNTLFDENASCHLALGEGFSNCLKDYEKYNLEQYKQKGINHSIVHEDFMIGTPDLTITATTHDGKTLPIFENGNWAF